MVITTRASSEATHPGAQYFWERGLVASDHGSHLRGRLLIKYFWGLIVMLSRDLRACMCCILPWELSLLYSRVLVPLGKSFTHTLEATTQEPPLIACLGWPKGLLLGPTGQELWRDSSWQAINPRTQKAKWHTTSLSAKEAYLLSLKLQVWQTSRGLRISNYVPKLCDQNSVVLA